MNRDPKSEPRRRDPSLLAYLKVQCDCCEITGLVGNLHLHHVVLRSQGGDDLRANILCMHGSLHDRYHAADPVARRLVAEHVHLNRHDIVAYLKEKLKTDDGYNLWLERHGIDAPEAMVT